MNGGLPFKDWEEQRSTLSYAQNKKKYFEEKKFFIV